VVVALSGKLMEAQTVTDRGITSLAWSNWRTREPLWHEKQRKICRVLAQWRFDLHIKTKP
jgi:hypothetical protein